MALLLITNPPSTLTLSSQWTDFVTRENASTLGTGLSIPIFTLTNWDATTTKPAIAQGSIIEVGGSLYQADADTALTDEAGLIDGTVHIKLVPAGGGASVVPTLTNDVIPAWDGNKAGWYDTDDKFLPYEMTKASAVYTLKSEYSDQGKETIVYVDGKTLKTDTIIEKTVGAGVTVDGTLIKDGYISPTKGVSVAFEYTAITAKTSNEWFLAFSPYINIGQKFKCTGGVNLVGTIKTIASSIERFSSTVIYILVLDVGSGNVTTITIASGGTNMLIGNLAI